MLFANLFTFYSILLKLAAQTQAIGITKSAKDSMSSSNTNANAKPSGNSIANTSTSVKGIASGVGAGAGVVVNLKQLQEAFATSLVSSASLDYLSISSIIDEDYADIK